MFQYWTSWNFMWYLGAQNGYFPVNNALKFSILTTSVLGGFMAYIYPRKMIIRGEDSNYKVPYPMLLAGDLFFHQLPLFHIYYTANTEDTCATKILIPISYWTIYNIIKETDMNRLYGIPISYLYATSVVVLGTGGIMYHNFKVNFSNVCKSIMQN
jgi:hypothetical protein